MSTSHKIKQSGFNLIELLISMLIGSVLMLGIFQLFASSNKANKLLIVEAEMQENARFAFSILTSVIQQTGNYGCKSRNASSDSSLLRSPNAAFTPWLLISGWEAADTDYGDTYTPEINTSVSNLNTNHWLSSASAAKDTGVKSKRYSDVLKVWYTKKQIVTLNTIATNVLTFPSIDLKKGDILVINDCESLNFVQVCTCDDGDSTPCSGSDNKANISPSVCNTPGNDNFDFSNLNRATTEISVLEEAIFYVGKRDDSSSGYRDNPPSLYVKHLGDKAKPRAKEELLEGVESLQVLYGEDINNNQSANYYVSANQVVNWNNIVSVKVSILLRSRQKNVLREKQNINFNGVAIAPSSTDRYLRRVYTSTIALRNRNLGY